MFCLFDPTKTTHLSIICRLKPLIHGFLSHERGHTLAPQVLPEPRCGQISPDRSGVAQRPAELRVGNVAPGPAALAADLAGALELWLCPVGRVASVRGDRGGHAGPVVDRHISPFGRCWLMR